MKKITRQFAEARASNEDRKVKFIFSTDAKDRHGTRINPRGWRLDNFNKNGVASYQHRASGDPDPDKIIGPAEAWMRDGKLMGTIDFEPGDINPLADKLYKKVKNGTLNAVSVGFLEHKGHWGDKEEKEEEETYYFDDIELMEISLVSIPSNPEALAVRSFEAVDEDEEFDAAVREILKKRNLTDLTEQVTKSINKMEDEVKKDLPETSKVEVNVTLDTKEFEKQVDRLVETVTPKKEPVLPGAPAQDMSEKDAKTIADYRISTAILKQANAMRGEGKLDGLELEMHQEAVEENRLAGVPTSGLGIPSMIQQRALKAITDSAGGYTVATELPFLIPFLENNMATLAAGATLMTGLQGDLSIPTVSASTTALWVSEGGSSTESNPTFGAVTMSPNRLTAHSVFTRQLLKQTSFDVEKIVRENLFYGVANALESAVFTADGTSQTPVGLDNQSINNAAHGSSTTVSNWDNIVGMETMVNVDNALGGRLAYITNATAAGSLKTTKKDTYQGGYIWEIYSPVAPKGVINGYDAFVTNVLTNSTTNPIYFGNWAELMIGQWGAIDLQVNPFSLDTSGSIRVVISGYYDVECKHPESFSFINALAV